MSHFTPNIKKMTWAPIIRLTNHAAYGMMYIR